MGNRPRINLDGAIISRKDFGHVFYDLKGNILQVWKIAMKTKTVKRCNQYQTFLDIKTARWVHIKESDIDLTDMSNPNAEP